MGKLKRRSKAAVARAKNNSLQKSTDIQNSASADAKKIAPLLEKLSSTSPNDKCMAISSITLLCDRDQNIRTQFLKQNLIKLVFEKCLNDNNDEVTTTAFGLLRNLVIEEGYDIAIYLWRQDIWISIEVGLKKSIESLKHLNDSNIKSENKIMLFDFIDNLLSLISGISDTSDELFDKIYDKFYNNGFVNLIKDIIELQKYQVNSKLLISTLNFIYEMSTLSYRFIDDLHNESKINYNNELILNKLKNNQLAKSLLIGINFQNFEFELKNNLIDSNKEKLIDDKLIESLINIKDIYSEIDINSVMEFLNKPIDNANTANSNNSSNQKIEDLKLLSNQYKYQAIDILVDLLITNIEIKGELIEFSKMNSNNGNSKIDERFIEYHFEFTLPIIKNLLEHKEFHTKAMSLLNNLSWFILSVDYNSEPNWIDQINEISKQIIPKLFNLINDKTNSDLEIVNDFINSSWVLVKTNTDNLINEFHIEHIDTLISYSNELLNKFISQNDKSQEQLQQQQEQQETQEDKLDPNLLTNYLTSLIGLLTIFAKFGNNLEITKKCSDFIINNLIVNFITIYNSIKNISELRKIFNVLIESTLNESINSIFEIFDDKSYEYDLPLYINGNLNKLLETEIHPAFKKIYKNIDKKNFPELKTKLQETLNNLERFIQYKSSERQ
ncbi:hypothetical protein B5S31_g3092 [[Candida] boidinii]|nr:hypothetical protein B5S31_g3092 [[Candida] boidinii]